MDIESQLSTDVAPKAERLVSLPHTQETLREQLVRLLAAIDAAPLLASKQPTHVGQLLTALDDKLARDIRDETRDVISDLQEREAQVRLDSHEFMNIPMRIDIVSTEGVSQLCYEKEIPYNPGYFAREKIAKRGALQIVDTDDGLTLSFQYRVGHHQFAAALDAGMPLIFSVHANGKEIACIQLQPHVLPISTRNMALLKGLAGINEEHAMYHGEYVTISGRFLCTINARIPVDPNIFPIMTEVSKHQPLLEQ